MPALIVLTFILGFLVGLAAAYSLISDICNRRCSACQLRRAGGHYKKEI